MGPPSAPTRLVPSTASEPRRCCCRRSRAGNPPPETAMGRLDASNMACLGASWNIGTSKWFTQCNGWFSIYRICTKWVISRFVCEMKMAQQIGWGDSSCHFLPTDPRVVLPPHERTRQAAWWASSLRSSVLWMKLGGSVLFFCTHVNTIYKTN